MKYDHQLIEAKWQKYWQDHHSFEVEMDERPKYYVLDMFPYPSGSGLHVGHVVGYTATDIIARFKRQKGFNVLHPMGWDSFGLSAEQYAIRTGQHPAVTTRANIDNFRRQLKALGYSYDWEREVETSDPDYYKWTQWIFTKLYEKGLAYEAEMLVNYCPALGTVLANEEVEAGRSVDGGHLVERRPLKQWILKITEYADRLAEDLELVDWPDHIKKLQINWIGRSEGSLIRFPCQEDLSIEVFTTRADTLFGVSYLVLAPEHPLVERLTAQEHREAVTAYLEKTALKSDLDRTDLNLEKNGVFLGYYAAHPITQEPIPVWISDYVLMHYGTGAVMAVPAHDERDFEFAKRYGLPIKPVIEPLEGVNGVNGALSADSCYTGDGTLVESESAECSFDGLSCLDARRQITEWLQEKGLAQFKVSYKLRDWLFSRQRYWGEPIPILHFADGTKRALELDELPLSQPELSDFKPSSDGLSPLSKARDWVEVTDPKTGKKARREINTMPQWAGSCWYYLRFADPKNREDAFSQKAEQYWLPVDLYIGGVEHAVLHLLYARFWHKVLYDIGLVHTKEPFQKLRNQGLVVSPSFKMSDGRYVDPLDVEEVDGRYQLKGSQEIVSCQVEKMSKSKLNGVNPDEMMDAYGADALRVYEMFMGPLDKEKIWNSSAVNGSRRFLQRFFDLCASKEKWSDEMTKPALKLGYRLVHGVTSDIENMQFNTAIAKLMEFLNECSKLDFYPKRVLAWAVQCLMPFAPHLAEECWQLLGQKESLIDSPYPEVDAAYLQDDVVTYVVQVNGKLRGRFDLPKDQEETIILKLALENPNIQKHVDTSSIQKVVFVPNRLLNIVCS
ncbi:MAG: leuS [Chlamydiales bacterium]|nr:leuS [Chlamydiales bacterium]